MSVLVRVAVAATGTVVLLLAVPMLKWTFFAGRPAATVAPTPAIRHAAPADRDRLDPHDFWEFGEVEEVLYSPGPTRIQDVERLWQTVGFLVEAIDRETHRDPGSFRAPGYRDFLPATLDHALKDLLAFRQRVVASLVWWGQDSSFAGLRPDWERVRAIAFRPSPSIRQSTPALDAAQAILDPPDSSDLFSIISELEAFAAESRQQAVQLLIKLDAFPSTADRLPNWAYEWGVRANAVIQTKRYRTDLGYSRQWRPYRVLSPLEQCYETPRDSCDAPQEDQNGIRRLGQARTQGPEPLRMAYHSIDAARAGLFNLKGDLAESPVTTLPRFIRACDNAAEELSNARRHLFELGLCSNVEGQ